MSDLGYIEGFDIETRQPVRIPLGDAEPVPTSKVGVPLRPERVRVSTSLIKDTRNGRIYLDPMKRFAKPYWLGTEPKSILMTPATGNFRSVPVVMPIGVGSDGQAYNINADTVAGEIAAALGAEKLILMTDTPGLMRDFKDPDTLIRQLDIQGARALIEDGTVSGGMIPKLTCCVRSLAQGVRATHIIDGRLPHSLLLEIFTDTGTGSMIVSSGLME